MLAQIGLQVLGRLHRINQIPCCQIHIHQRLLLLGQQLAIQMPDKIDNISVNTLDVLMIERIGVLSLGQWRHRKHLTQRRFAGHVLAKLARQIERRRNDQPAGRSKVPEFLLQHPDCGVRMQPGGAVQIQCARTWTPRKLIVDRFSWRRQQPGKHAHQQRHPGQHQRQPEQIEQGME